MLFMFLPGGSMPTNQDNSAPSSSRARYVLALQTSGQLLESNAVVLSHAHSRYEYQQLAALRGPDGFTSYEVLVQGEQLQSIIFITARHQQVVELSYI